MGFRHDAHTRFLRRADPKYHWVSAPLETGWRRDQWLVADGPAQAGGSRRVYVIHTWPPRFRCRVVAVEPGTGLPEPDHANAGNRRSTLPEMREGDRVMVDTARRMPATGEMFVLWDGTGLVVKRIEAARDAEPPTLRLISANLDYPPYTCLAEDAHLVGKVLWTLRRV